jgi:hypothetical protein
MSEQIEDFKKFIAHIQSLNIQGKQRDHINHEINSFRLLYDF